MSETTYRVTVTTEGEPVPAENIEELLSRALAEDGCPVGSVRVLEEDLALRLEEQVAAVAAGERGIPLDQVVAGE